MLSLIEIIEKKIGHTLREEDQGIVDNLKQIPERMIDEARSLNNQTHAVLLLKYYTTNKNWPFLNSFVSDVILNFEKLNEWFIQDCLLPTISLKDQLCKQRKEILYISMGEYSVIVKPDYSLWIQGVRQSGSPIIPDFKADYASEPPNEFAYHSIKELDIIKIGNNPSSIILHFRRWIAQRIAKHLHNKNELTTFSTPDILNQIAPFNSWTDDAKKAFNGLIREREEIGWKEGEIPGYIGPDEFYN